MRVFYSVLKRLSHKYTNINKEEIHRIIMMRLTYDTKIYQNDENEKNKFIIFVVLLTALNECYHYCHCLPDGPCIVTINVYVRSISKISDLDMVSPLIQPKNGNMCIYSESFVRVHRVTVQPTKLLKTVCVLQN